MLQAGGHHLRRQPHLHVCAAAEQRCEGEGALGRAALLRQAALLSACSAAAALQPFQPAAAAAPGAAAAAAAAALSLPPLAPLRYSPSGPHSRLELADPQLLPLPPGPIAFPRRQLELNFAVLQLRSGYEAVDDLDCIPMVRRGCSLSRMVVSGAGTGLAEEGMASKGEGGEPGRGQPSNVLEACSACAHCLPALPLPQQAERVPEKVLEAAAGGVGAVHAAVFTAAHHAG